MKSTLLTRRVGLARRALFGGAQDRYEARHRVLSALAHRWGFRVYNSNLIWQDDAEYLQVWRQFPEATDEIKDRKYLLWSLAKAVATLPGDTAECGVFNGGSSFLMCMARENVRPDGALHHVFDSFEGLSEPEQVDKPTSAESFVWQAHDLSVPEDVVQRNLARFDHVRLHKGWIPDRFDEVADRRFSLVHIDVDLYQPTLDSIAFFYERTVAGGVLLCDDYGSAGCPGARRAFGEFVEGRPETAVVHVPTGQGFIVKR